MPFLTYPVCWTTFWEVAFCVAGPSVWNAFPEFLRLSDCTATSQRRCSLYILIYLWYPVTFKLLVQHYVIASLWYHLVLLAAQVLRPRIFQQCRDPDDNSKPILRCLCGLNQVIRIHSAEVRLTHQCPLDVECTRLVTNHSEITRCNGEYFCRISQDILKYNLTEDNHCGQHQKRNYLKVIYDCINGKLKCLLLNCILNIIT